MKARYARNSEAILARLRAVRRSKGAKAYEKRSHLTKKEIERIKYLKAYAKNREVWLARVAAYRRDHPQSPEYQRAWRRKNPAACKVLWSRRRSRKAAALGSFTAREWEGVLAEHKGCCFDCGKSGKMTVGHLIPLSKGGSNFIGNLKPQCGSCNSKQKDAIHPKAVLSLFDRIPTFP
jgi:5-methylcytosine-specific restriction endonuclease McrA